MTWRHVDSVTPTTTMSFSTYTPAVKPSTLLPPSSRNSHDNSLPSIALHPSRPIPNTIEEDAAAAPLCQQTTVEIHADVPLQCRDVVVRTAVRARPVTSRQTRASVRGRTASMPSWRPVNDGEHRALGVPATVGAADDFENFQEISISSPRTQSDNGRRCGTSSSAAISISLSGRAVVADGRHMSHVTLDFDPPPHPPRRFDPPPTVVASQQVPATSRPAHRDDQRSVRPSRTRDGRDAAGRAEPDAARRRYFSIAEWNRQKVLHLRRASLRRACLIGIPLGWAQRTGPTDLPQSRDSATAKSRRRQANRHQKTTDCAAGSSERKKAQSTAVETPSNMCRNQSLPPISERPAVASDRHRATRRRTTTTKSDHQQNSAVSNHDSAQKRATSYASGRCPPLILLAHHTGPPYITSRSRHKESEASEQTVTAHVQQKPEAYDSGLDSDAATRTTTEHQSLPATIVDLQKVKDVLEHPPSRGRTHKDDDDDEERNTKTACDDKDASFSSCVERVEDSSSERQNSRQTVDLPRYECIYQCF